MGTDGGLDSWCAQVKDDVDGMALSANLPSILRSNPDDPVRWFFLIEFGKRAEVNPIFIFLFLHSENRRKGVKASGDYRHE